MTVLKLYRGIAVPAASVADVTSSILRNGLVEGQGRWTIEQLWKLPSGVSTEKYGIFSEEIDSAEWRSAVCACGTPEGADYYAWEHNRNMTDETPILIEFEANVDQVRIDPRDFLFPAFQGGEPEIARDILEQVYGHKITKYINPAWASQDQGKRIALCHMATLDGDVILAHYENRATIRGKHGTIFDNAFTIAFPVEAKNIVCVRTPYKRETQATHSFDIKDILAVRTPQQTEPLPANKEDAPTTNIFDIGMFKYRD